MSAQHPLYITTSCILRYFVLQSVRRIGVPFRACNISRQLKKSVKSLTASKVMPTG